MRGGETQGEPGGGGGGGKQRARRPPPPPPPLWTVVPLTFLFRSLVMKRTTVSQAASALKRRHQPASLITRAKW